MFKGLAAVIIASLALLTGGGCAEQPVTQPETPQVADASPVIEVTVLAGDLDTPWAIDFAPDGRIFVTERPGRIRIVKGGKLQVKPWLTLDVSESGESGLLGLALDPQFTQNGFVYVAYTYRAADGRFQNRLVRLRDVAQGPDGAIYILTSNRDGRGQPSAGDDRILRLVVR